MPQSCTVQQSSSNPGIHDSIAFYYFSGMLGVPPTYSKVSKASSCTLHYLFACWVLFCEPVQMQLLGRSCSRLNHVNDMRLTQSRS